MNQKVSHLVWEFIGEPAGQLNALVNSSSRDNAVFVLESDNVKF